MKKELIPLGKIQVVGRKTFKKELSFLTDGLCNCPDSVAYNRMQANVREGK